MNGILRERALEFINGKAEDSRTSARISGANKAVLFSKQAELIIFEKETRRRGKICSSRCREETLVAKGERTNEPEDIAPLYRDVELV